MSNRVCNLTPGDLTYECIAFIASFLTRMMSFFRIHVFAKSFLESRVPREEGSHVTLCINQPLLNFDAIFGSFVN